MFGAAGLAYAVMPQLVDTRVGEWGLASALLAGLSAWLSYPIMLVAVAGVALICLAVVATGVRVTART
ncbi:hypothetical protein AB0K12_28815 [Nonomuraea sp. NPDC049419]|uniref:hypothetical protein n=1 Tax=Nonomuraea sp. NPDC049419 TaxID=3155772 RepID=UPI00342872AA